MKTTVEKLSPTRVKLSISVSPEELKPSIDHAYKHIAEQISIPGFRKGKVPPPIIDQRIGRAEVMNHAVNDGLDKFYRQAVEEQKVRPLGQPSADVTAVPDLKDFSGDLEVTVEVDVRPELTLPPLEGIELTVDAVEVTDEEVDRELDELRSRFGTLVTVDRPAKTGDFAQLDLEATIDGRQVDTAKGVSYEIGSGELIDGIDEALDTLTAGESTTFESVLLGGDNEGETAQITVTLLAVKERELPEADDDFAQIASQFDTIAELRDDMRQQVGRRKTFEQGSAARDQLVETLLSSLDIPVPDALVEGEVHRHLESENRLDDDEHRAEVVESSTRAFRTQILLDTIADQLEVTVSQDEVTQYLIQSAAQYNMDPGEFVKALDENGQIASMIGEVTRNKAIALVLRRAKVVDSTGAAVDLSELVGTDAPEGTGNIVSVDVDTSVDPEAAEAADDVQGEDAQGGEAPAEK